jgi:hypothetical protein
LRRRATDGSAGFTYVDDRCAPTMGMRLWTDPYARAKMFERLFTGPVAAGIDLPQSLEPSFPEVLPTTYPRSVTPTSVFGKDGAELDEAIPRKNFVLEGRGRSGQTVRLLRGSSVVGQATVSSGGRWSMTVPLHLTRSELLTLEYRSRNRMVGQLETSYCAADTSALSGAVQTYITVWKDTSLWRIAELLTGDGDNYVALYRKNRDVIQDMERIYPGQILAVPGITEWNR